MREAWQPGWQGGRFCIKETTADVGVVAEGRDLESAVASAVCGMYRIISPAPARDGGRTLEARGEARDLPLAFAEALQRLVIAFDAESFIGAACSVGVRQSEAHAEVTLSLRGETFDPARNPPGVEIKAVTHHELVVDERGHRVEVLFDV